MAEQDEGGAVAVGGVVQRGVPGGAGGRLRAVAARGDLDGDDVDRVEAERAQGPGGAGGHLRRAGLEPVVDDDGAGTQPGGRRLDGRRRRERQGVGAPAARDEHEVTGRAVAEDVTDGDTDRRRRGIR